jgi:hypothetical protein
VTQLLLILKGLHLLPLPLTPLIVAHSPSARWAIIPLVNLLLLILLLLVLCWNPPNSCQSSCSQPFHSASLSVLPHFPIDALIHLPLGLQRHWQQPVKQPRLLLPPSAAHQ